MLEDRPYAAAEVKQLIREAEDRLIREFRRTVYALYPSPVAMPNAMQRRGYSDAVMAALRCLQ